MKYSHIVLQGLSLAVLALESGGCDAAGRTSGGSKVSVSPQTNEALRYLGESPPGELPEVFAPGRVSLPDAHEFGSVFSADGLELFYGVDVGDRAEIRTTVLEGDVWSPPRVVLAHDTYSYNDPFLSPTGDRLYFISDQSATGVGDPKDIDIWYVERQDQGWSEPINAGPAINSNRNEYYISFTADGTIFFASNAGAEASRLYDFDLYSARFEGNLFSAPERLAGAVNTRDYEADVFVAPDASYLIFSSSRREGLGRGDLYISFRRDDGTWSEGRNMGLPINTAGHELCPFVSWDGKYLFYTSDQDIYWVDAAVIEKYR